MVNQMVNNSTIAQNGASVNMVLEDAQSIYDYGVMCERELEDIEDFLPEDFDYENSDETTIRAAAKRVFQAEYVAIYAQLTETLPALEADVEAAKLRHQAEKDYVFSGDYAAKQLNTARTRLAWAKTAMLKIERVYPDVKALVANAAKSSRPAVKLTSLADYTAPAGNFIESRYWRMRYRAVTVMVGASGVGKSWINEYHAIEQAIANPGKAYVIIALEHPEQYDIRKTVFGVLPSNVFIVTRDNLNSVEHLNLYDENSVADLVADLSNENVGGVYIDNAGRAVRGVSLRNTDHINAVMQNLDWLSDQLGCYVVLNHHTPKGNKRTFAGSQAFEDNADTMIFIERTNGTLKIAETKQRMSEARTTAFEANTLTSGNLKSVAVTKVEELADHVRTLLSKQAMRLIELSEATGKTNKELLRALKHLGNSVIKNADGTYELAE